GRHRRPGRQRGSAFVSPLLRPRVRRRVRAEEERGVRRTRARRGVPRRAARRPSRMLHGRLDETTQPGVTRVNNRILVLGGGVAGASIAYYLTEKGFDVTIIEKNRTVGGLARTCYYAGHPYEFGPHIWFWPGGKEAPINATVVSLTNDELFYIDRRLFT